MREGDSTGSLFALRGERRNFAPQALDFPSMNKTRPFLAAAASLALSLSAPALAQKLPSLPQPAVPDPEPSEVVDNKGIERRLQRDEKALKDLRQIVLQAKAQGAPVEVKDAGPDPQVQALDARVKDLEDTLRRQTGQMEQISHNADLAAKAAADAADANKALQARVDRLEQQLIAAGAAALSGGPGQPGPGGAPGALAAPPQGGGVLGTLRGNGPAPDQDVQGDPNAGGPGDEQQAYRAARASLDSGDYVGGAQALQDFLQRYPSSQRAGEANYWLGRTLALRNMHAEAASAYARALKGWPQAAWAGDAVLRLSTSLIELDRKPDACKALVEFNSRYSTKSAAALKTRARDIRSRASCS